MLNLQLKWNKDLDHVEDGKVEWIKIIDEFYQDFENNLNSRKGNGKSRN